MRGVVWGLLNSSRAQSHSLPFAPGGNAVDLRKRPLISRLLSAHWWIRGSSGSRVSESRTTIAVASRRSGRRAEDSSCIGAKVAAAGIGVVDVGRRGAALALHTSADAGKGILDAGKKGAAFGAGALVSLPSAIKEGACKPQHLVKAGMHGAVHGAEAGAHFLGSIGRHLIMRDSAPVDRASFGSMEELVVREKNTFRDLQAENRPV